MEMSIKGDRSGNVLSDFVISSEAITTISGSLDKKIPDKAPANKSRAHAEHYPKTSLKNTFINFIKANIGTGILALPDAIKHGGLFFGNVCMILLGILVTYCGHELLHAYVQVSGGTIEMSFSEVTYAAFDRLPSRKLKRLARASKIAVDVFIVLTQLGTCCVYILAVSRMIREVVDFAIPSLGWDIRIYASLLLIPLIPSSFVTTLKYQGYVSLIANILQFSGLVIILQYVFRNLGPIDNLNYIPPTFSSVPLFFGTAMFDLGITTFILPMEACMTNRKAFHGWDGLMSLCMSIVVIIYVVVGFYGYQAFGSESRMILSNLPRNDWLYNTVKLMIATAIFLSYNLQFYFPIDLVYPALQRRVNKPWFDRFGEYLFRAALVLLTYGFAVSIPCLELMISLVGALTAGCLSIVVPPLLELVCCFHPNGKGSLWIYLKCAVIILLGTFACVVGSVVAIQDIVNALRSAEGCPN